MLALTCALIAASGALAAEAPVNDSPPTIAGTLADGQRVKASKGSWSSPPGPIEYAYRWSRCDSSGANCKEIPSATKLVYRVVSADVGHTLRIAVKATGSTSETTMAGSAPTAVVLARGPRKGKAPRITGTAEDGQVLTVATGSWKGTEPLSFSYQWESCVKGGACTPLSGQTSASYRVVSTEIGGTVRAVVTATNAAGSASAKSRPSKHVIPGPPVNIVLPAISGSVQEGQALTADTGTWAGTGPFTYSYEWERCSLLGGDCEPIAGATEPTYSLTAQDLSAKLAVIVTATGALGTVSATSTETSSVLAILPSNTIPPSISGLLQDGGLVSALTGVWSGTQPIRYSYEWEICNALGETCKELIGASGPTLELGAADIGSTLEVVVTATNAAGSSSVASPVTGLIEAILPKNTALPSITGLLQDGQLLGVSNGSWSGSEPISYSYQWQLCNALGKACGNISEATGSGLSLSPADIGKTLDVVVTATNAAGSTSATTSVTGLIEAILPKNTALPSITGLLQDGQSLNAASGTWSGSQPISYTYQWQLCNASGGACGNISEALGSALKLSSADVGSTLRVIVTATNAAGSVSSTSAATGLISALLPSSTSLPTITGLLKSGQLLSASAGSWSGSTPMSFGYQWQLCNVLGSGCTNIAKATGSTFLLGLLDVGLPLRVVVTATNAAGSVAANSAVTGLIEGVGL